MDLIFSCLIKSHDIVASNTENSPYAVTALRFWLVHPNNGESRFSYARGGINYHFLVDRGRDSVYCVAARDIASPDSDQLPTLYMESCKKEFDQMDPGLELAAFGAVLDSMLVHFRKNSEVVIRDSKTKTAETNTAETKTAETNTAETSALKTSDVYSILAAVGKDMNAVIKKLQMLEGYADLQVAAPLANQLNDIVGANIASVRSRLQSEKLAQIDTTSSSKKKRKRKDTKRSNSSFIGAPTKDMELILLEENQRKLDEGDKFKGKGKAGEGVNQRSIKRWRKLYPFATHDQAHDLIARINARIREANEAAANTKASKDTAGDEKNKGDSTDGGK